MPRGDKGSHTKKQKQQAEHIEEGYERRGGAYPQDHERCGKAQGDHPLIEAAIAEPRDVTASRPPLMQNEYEQSEDDMQQERLGPRGVSGEKFPFGMTPERQKKTPVSNDPGHTA